MHQVHQLRREPYDLLLVWRPTTPAALSQGLVTAWTTTRGKQRQRAQ